MNEVGEIINKFIKQNLPTQSDQAKVISVDETTLTATVRFATGLELSSVALSGVDKQTGLVCIPQVGSTVFIDFLGGKLEEPYIALFSEVQKVLVKCENTTIAIDGQQVKFNEGSNGGVIIASKLVSELKQITQFLIVLRSTINAMVPVPSDGGAALKAALVAALQPLTLPTFTDIENDKLKH